MVNSWSRDSPNGRERTKMAKKCGERKCFLGPNKSFPICRKNTCTRDMRGVRAALYWAQSLRDTRGDKRKYAEIQKKAEEILRRSTRRSYISKKRRSRSGVKSKRRKTSVKSKRRRSRSKTKSKRRRSKSGVKSRRHKTSMKYKRRRSRSKTKPKRRRSKSGVKSKRRKTSMKSRRRRSISKRKPKRRRS